MLTLILIVFAPVIVAAVALAALLAGAATAGAWESLEERRERKPAAGASTFRPAAQEDETHAQAA